MEDEAVGPYVVKSEFLGKGAWSIVQSAIDVRSGAEVAAKIIEKLRLDEWSKPVMEEGLREVVVMRCLPPHRNLVRLLDVSENVKNYYVFLERLQEDLGTVLINQLAKDGKGLPEARTRRYFRHIVCGLGAMHNMGVLHRDVKPENMLLDAHDVVKITDFGLAKRLPKSRFHVSHVEELSKELAGTYRYSAPEMFSPPSAGYDGFLADVWSVGVCLFVLLTGSFPFPMPPNAERDPKSVWVDILRTTDIAIPSYVSPHAHDLLLKLLTKDPSKRIRLEETLDHPWVTSVMPLTVEDAAAEIAFFRAQMRSLRSQLDAERALHTKQPIRSRSASALVKKAQPPSPASVLRSGNSARTTKSVTPMPSPLPQQRSMSARVVPSTGNAIPLKTSQVRSPSQPANVTLFSVTQQLARTPSPGARQPLPTVNPPPSATGRTLGSAVRQRAVPVALVKAAVKRAT